jgi:hypothetical protein
MRLANVRGRNQRRSVNRHSPSSIALRARLSLSDTAPVHGRTTAAPDPQYGSKKSLHREPGALHGAPGWERLSIYVARTRCWRYQYCLEVECAPRFVNTLKGPTMTALVQNIANTVSGNHSTTNETEDQHAVATVLETYRLGFLRLDLEQLASIWDREHEPLIYVAQEKDEPLHGWPAIQAYLAALPEHLDEVLAKDLDSVQIDVVGDTAITFFTSRSRVKLKGRPTTYEPIGHVSMIFRRLSEGWRAVHYHESARSAQAAQVMEAMQAKPRSG